MRSPHTFALLLWGSVAVLAALGPDRATLWPATVAYTSAFLALLHLWRRHRAYLDDPRVLLGGAVLLRVTLFPALPDLSDDLFRYVWDGWLSFSGMNPYLYPPADPALAAWQGSPLYLALNSAAYHSVYPPLSQVVFFAGGAAYEHLGWPAAAYVVKGGFLALEVAGIAGIFFALRALGRECASLALYAWNPLVLVTIAGSGHTEGGLTAALGLLAFGVASGRGKTAWCGLVLAAASKGVPIVLAPLLFRRLKEAGGSGRALGDAWPAALLALALALPVIAPGALAGVISSLDLYVRLFEFNGGLYLLAQEVVRAFTGEDYGRTIGPLLRWLFLGIALLVSLRWPVRGAEDWFQGALLLFGLYLATATTVHPWYLGWGLALVPLTSFIRGPWLWASWAAFLTYFTYAGGPHGVLTAIFWGGVALFLVRDLEGAIRDRLLRWAGRRKARQLEDVLQDGSLLDLGAGEGYVAAELRRADRTIYLMDVRPSFQVPLPGVVYDGSRVPLRDGAVDTVLLSLALHHAENPDRVLAEALRVARKRVLVTESTYRWGWERNALEVADRWANRGRGMETKEAGGGATLHFRTVGSWLGAFSEAGAEVLESRRLNRVGHRHHLFVLRPRGVRGAPAPLP